MESLESNHRDLILINTASPTEIWNLEFQSNGLDSTEALKGWFIVLTVVLVILHYPFVHIQVPNPTHSASKHNRKATVRPEAMAHAATSRSPGSNARRMVAAVFWTRSPDALIP